MSTDDPLSSTISHAAAVVCILLGVTLNWQTATVRAIKLETPRVKSFTLELPEWRPFRPGQHYDVRLTAPDDYQAWLAGGSGETLASTGEKLFQELSCNTCHRADSGGRGPLLDGLFGRTVSLQGGGRVTADEAYLRESIVNPGALQVDYHQISN